jgi:hypothetical protein
MIRIGTTAEFDAEGRFTVTGQTTEPISPGTHPVMVEIQESSTGARKTTTAVPPGLRKEGHIWVLDCVGAEDPEEVRQRLDEEATRRILEGPFE